MREMEGGKGGRKDRVREGGVEGKEREEKEGIEEKRNLREPKKAPDSTTVKKMTGTGKMKWQIMKPCTYRPSKIDKLRMDPSCAKVSC